MKCIRYTVYMFYFFLVIASVRPLSAGVVNPDISAIGQVFGTYTDDSLAESPLQPKKGCLSLGETELNLDAALNPYFMGAFVLSIDNEGGVEVEEAYASMIRGLPWNIALKAGKYRLNFGKLNQAHPHAYPFLRTPRVLSPDIAKLIPGDESFNDVAAEASTLISVAGSWAIIPSVDFLEGNSFHSEDQGISHAWLAHVSNSFMLGTAECDVGVSATQGVNNISTNTKTAVLGLDAKAKIPGTAIYSMTIGSEYIYKLSDEIDTEGTKYHDNRYGFYAYIDNRFYTRYNAGVLYEQYQNPDDRSGVDRAIKPFVGFAVLEESTLLRASYEYFMSGNSQKTNTVELQLLFSMGPHKAHQF
ncbi:MAG TPA: hypothetical protein DCO75_06905 [Fibrobacteres bacterium]|jgi:hypothetical protein|nr:hypothetical protein [Fibrobacterota bacterium]